MRLVFLLFTILFTSCALDDGKPLGVLFEYDQEHEGMIRIKSEGNRVVLGTSESTAKFSESPKMNVDFTYSFSISKNEVTRNEYAEFMGGESSSIQDSGDLPQTNVTYYDAVLYANARSVSEGYDTAYTYSSVIYDAKGNCTYLDSLLFNPSKEAYRLPTEAEWVFAASHNWRPNQGWNNLNSDYRVHKVCTADINALSICDMVGNAMEWVNDHLGNFKDTTLINYIGAPKENSFKERIVKGGSYHKSPSQAQLYSRGDVYTVTSSTKAEYVGFRLVFGRIPDPLYFDSKNEISNQFNIVASLSSIKEMTESNHLKMAFVNKGSSSLVYADFAKMGLSLYEIKDNLKVNHPDISPDGNYVAFCTGLEGVSGSSQVYVRDLNPSGSNLVRLNVESAAIPRFRVLPSGDTVIVYVSDAGNNKDDAEWKQKSTWQVPFKNGKFGKPVKLFDGSYHGGFSEDGSLAVTGARLLRANLNGKESLWYNGEQACNASLSKDSTKRTMFLDFGGKSGADFVGSSYETHERLLIADSTGTLIQSIAAPENFAFDHSEWSNIKNIAVSSVTNRNLAHTALYLISTEDSLLLKVVEGNELWHPSLWVNKQNLLLQTDLDLDSAGVYLAKDNVVGMSYVLRYKMELLWKYYDSVEIAITGSSRSLHGIIPMSMSSGFAVNFAHTPNDIFISEYFVNNYFIPLFPKLKTIIVSLDLDIWFKEKENDWKNNYASAPGYTYDSTHGFWKDSIPKGMYEITKNAWGASDSLRSLYTNDRGYFDLPSVGWREKKAEISRDTIDFFEKMRTSAALSALENMIQIASASDVNVIGVIFPLSPWYKETGAFGRYGLKRSHAKMLIEEMNAFEDKYLNFYLMDENKMGDHDYTEEIAFDYEHLSVLGAVQLTSRLDSLLQTLE